MKQMWSKEEILKLIENNSYYIHELLIDGVDAEDKNYVGAIRFISNSKEPTLDVNKMYTLLASSLMTESNTLSGIINSVNSITPTSLKCYVVGNDTNDRGVSEDVSITLDDLQLNVYDANGNVILSGYYFD